MTTPMRRGVNRGEELTEERTKEEGRILEREERRGRGKEKRNIDRSGEKRRRGEQRSEQQRGEKKVDLIRLILFLPPLRFTLASSLCDCWHSDGHGLV